MIFCLYSKAWSSLEDSTLTIIAYHEAEIPSHLGQERVDNLIREYREKLPRDLQTAIIKIPGARDRVVFIERSSSLMKFKKAVDYENVTALVDTILRVVSEKPDAILFTKIETGAGTIVFRAKIVNIKTIVKAEDRVEFAQSGAFITETMDLKIEALAKSILSQVSPATPKDSTVVESAFIEEVGDISPDGCTLRSPCSGLKRGGSLYLKITSQGYAAAYLQDQGGFFFNQEGRLLIENATEGEIQLWPGTEESIPPKIKLYIVTSYKEIPTYDAGRRLTTLPQGNVWGPIHLKTSLPECRFNNLLKCSVPVRIFFPEESRLTTSTVTGALVIEFANIRKFSGIAFKFSPALDVREFTQLDIRGTATRDFNLVIEYKARIGGEAKEVTKSEFQLFPAANEVSTIQIPLTYSGTVDEITLMFYVKGEASRATIESIRLSK